MMPPEPAFIMGLLTGSGGLLTIQAFARRKVRQALIAADPALHREATLRREEDERRMIEVDALRQRLAVLERITIDPAVRTAREIEQLRIETN